MSQNLTAGVTQPRPALSPWEVKNPKNTRNIILASTVPALVALAITSVFSIDGVFGLLLLFMPIQIFSASWVGFKIFGRKGVADSLLVIFTIFFSTLVGVLLLSVLYSVISEGFKAISPQFFIQNNVFITDTTSLEYGGVGHAILGTFIIVGLTTLVTVPLGIALAVYLTETYGKARGTVRTLVQAMSGLPSVVAGLFVYSAFVASGATRYAGWLGSLALIPLMLPTVTRVAEEGLRLVPVELRNGALALGAPSYRAFFQVTLPAAKSGIITAFLLGVARIIGETAPLLLTVAYANDTVADPLKEMAALPTYIFQNLGANDTSQQRAWGAALVILIMVGIIFTAARMATRSKKAKIKKVKK
ncbi:MAG: phosphate ABC transporter permease PstA [Microbacteriaceae bacterium]|nr:phosphate ABC transporter permease PstA [Microbacteriaceae bacterium]